MIPYTTPTITLMVDADLTGMSVYVTIEQGETEITIDDATVTVEGGSSTIDVTLTQAQTALFSRGSCNVQVNWMDATGNRTATVVRSIPIGVQLLDSVLE